MHHDPFDEIARIIETAGSPFPVAHMRRLFLRATASAGASEEIARAIERLNILDVLAIVLAEIGDGPSLNRPNALSSAHLRRSVSE